jgi:hypothetical protein
MLANFHKTEISASENFWSSPDAKKLIFGEKTFNSQTAKSKTNSPNETISIVKAASKHYNLNVARTIRA